MARAKDTLYIAVGGHVVAIDTATGEEIWRTRLKGSMVCTVWLDGKRLYGGANGELFCLDPARGTILWRNRLKGLGTGVVAFAGSSTEVAAAAAAAAAAAVVT
jgi:outer membrane protein assembly factor BamB